MVFLAKWWFPGQMVVFLATVVVFLATVEYPVVSYWPQWSTMVVSYWPQWSQFWT